jgi:hypothetical protein
MDKSHLIKKKSLVINPNKEKFTEGKLDKMEKVLFQLGDAILQLNTKLAMCVENNEGLLKLVEAQGKEIDRLGDLINEGSDND